MTPNEKAATFIGWSEGQDCGYCKSFVEQETTYGALNKFPAWANCSNSKQRPARHTLYAPDMGDPRNYMRALESIKDQAVSISYYVIHGGWCCETEKGLDASDYLWPTVHEAIIKVLAALYDAKPVTPA